MSIKLKVLITAVFLIAAMPSLRAQRMAITSNLLEDALLTPNMGVDIVVSDRQSVSFDVSYAPYKLFPQFHNKHMSFRAAYKYWFNQTFYAHYLSLDAIASSSDVALGQWNSKDEYLALGLGYGYSFILSKRFNIIPSIGLGLAYGQTYEGHDHMIEPGKGVEATAVTGFKPVLTRLSVTIQYILK